MDVPITNIGAYIEYRILWLLYIDICLQGHIRNSKHVWSSTIKANQRQTINYLYKIVDFACHVDNF